MERLENCTSTNVCGNTYDENHVKFFRTLNIETDSERGNLAQYKFAGINREISFYCIYDFVNVLNTSCVDYWKIKHKSDQGVSCLWAFREEESLFLIVTDEELQHKSIFEFVNIEKPHYLDFSKSEDCVEVTEDKKYRANSTSSKCKFTIFKELTNFIGYMCDCFKVNNTIYGEFSHSCFYEENINSIIENSEIDELLKEVSTNWDVNLLVDPTELICKGIDALKLWQQSAPSNIIDMLLKEPDSCGEVLVNRRLFSILNAYQGKHTEESLIEKLPEEIMKAICEMLEYKDVVALYLTSHKMKELCSGVLFPKEPQEIVAGYIRGNIDERKVKRVLSLSPFAKNFTALAKVINENISPCDLDELYKLQVILKAVYKWAKFDGSFYKLYDAINKDLAEQVCYIVPMDINCTSEAHSIMYKNLQQNPTISMDMLPKVLEFVSVISLPF